MSKSKLAALLLGLNLVIFGCVTATANKYKNVGTIQPDLWSEIFMDPKGIDDDPPRIVFAVTSDGDVRAFVKEPEEGDFVDPGGYPIEETKLGAVAFEIGGENTKVCWWSGGQKHCNPPPPH